MKKPAPQAQPVDITYIVSAWNRPLMLPVCLWSLANQTHRDFEVVVTDNADDPKIAALHRKAVANVRSVTGARFLYARTAKSIEVSDCYHAAEWAIEHHARGSWYCFPCDDTYLVPEFGQRMLTAAYRDNLELVICKQLVVGPEASGGSGYRIWNMTIGRTIKTSLLIKASVFGPGFAKTNQPAPVEADYFFSRLAADRGVKCGFVDEVMVVHN